MQALQEKPELAGEFRKGEERVSWRLAEQIEREEGRACQEGRASGPGVREASRKRGVEETRS
eukprot:845972-Lingulodinium_polyedra.AAC.1